ncbi:MAG: response regulator transcription factor [Chloroflexi bacterium]|nr:response regulator transcription factor [Chloroflexota bacterium]
MTTILLVDDHAVVRFGVRMLLGAEAEFLVIGEASDGHSAITAVATCRPDVAVIDMSLPDMSGIEVVRQIRVQSPSTAVLMLTMHNDDALLRQAITAGATGYVVKSAVGTELVEAIKTVAQGGVYIHPSMMAGLVRGIVAMAPGSEPASALAASLTPLTPRETDVLRLLAAGNVNREIAETLHVSVRTVDTHRMNIMDKLSAQSRADLVRYARDHNLL